MEINQPRSLFRYILPVTAFLVMAFVFGCKNKDEDPKPEPIDYSLILINEVMVMDDEEPFFFPSGFGTGYPWVEIYNYDQVEIDISGCYIAGLQNEFNPGNRFPHGTKIASHDHLLIICSGDTALTGTNIHVFMSLSTAEGMNDKVYLYKPDSTLITTSSSFGFNSGIGADGHGLDPEKSYGRSTDASAGWLVFPVPTPGSPNIWTEPPYQSLIVINEFMCTNQQFIADEYGDFDDWIELYNPENEAVDVGGWYISDNISNFQLCRIADTVPALTTIPPGGHLLLWADDDPEQGVLHLPMKLSSGGESIIISADGVTILNKITFGESGDVAVPPPDKSAGRRTDGSESLVVFDLPTPGSQNLNTSFNSLILTDSVLLTVPEPSALSAALTLNRFLTVSDNTNIIYEMSVNGTVTNVLEYYGNDLEGITVRPSDQTIWVLEEIDMQVVQLDMQGNELNRWELDYTINSDKGPEGISYHPHSDRFFIVNESDPGLLIEWSPNGGIIKIINLDFANDFSDITCDLYNPDVLWILSDEEMKLYKVNKDGEKIDSWKLGIEKAEGLSLDLVNGKLYCVCDNTRKLYYFDLLQ